MIKKDLFANIAQIILVVILLPMLCLILVEVNSAQNTLEMLLNMVGQIPVFDTLMESVSLIMQMHDPALIGNPDIYLTHIESVVDSLNKSLFQVFSIALCVKLSNLAFDLLRGRGMHILSSMIGVLLGYYVSTSYEFPILASLFLFLLLFIVDLIFVQSVSVRISSLIIKYLVFSLKMILKILTTVFMTGFFAVLLVIWQGYVADIGVIIFMVCVFAVPWFILAATERYFFK